MAIKLKVAATAKEINDVLQLRHHVYVIEDQKFDSGEFADKRIYDAHDALPEIKNIIAYDGDIAVGTIRVNMDTGAGLPSEKYFDFSAYRSDVCRQSNSPCIFASAGMLAIKSKWRRRRDVIQALMKMATDVCHQWGVTHVIATSNHETVSVYKRLGFEPLGEAFWVEEIGNQVVPMATAFKQAYNWAFGGLLSTNLDRFWLDKFSGHFERVLFSSGDTIFEEGDEGNSAYIIDNGWVALTRRDFEGRELAIATLAPGALFGELSLVDKERRSATAVASTNVELIVLKSQVFLNSVQNNEKVSSELIKVFAERIRRTDELAMVLAYAPQSGRVQYALDDLRKAAKPDPKNENTWIVKIGPSSIAKSAGVREHEVLRILEIERASGRLDYGKSVIKFFQ